MAEVEAAGWGHAPAEKRRTVEVPKRLARTWGAGGTRRSAHASLSQGQDATLQRLALRDATHLDAGVQQ
jgi:hypothetical protein